MFGVWKKSLDCCIDFWMGRIMIWFALFYGGDSLVHLHGDSFSHRLSDVAI
jgi:hypothetical protein